MNTLINVVYFNKNVDNEIKNRAPRVLYNDILNLDREINNINKSMETDKELVKEYGILKNIGIDTMKKYLSTTDKLMEDEILSD